jgi:hypothetical protein
MASLTNWLLGTSLPRQAAIASANALDPLMRVRSRSKNAALVMTSEAGVASSGCADPS